MPPAVGRRPFRRMISDDDPRLSLSILQYLGPATCGSCGYCKRGRKKPGETTTTIDEPSYSLGLWAHELTVSDYNDLCDVGWRRSGKYLYKPIMDKTCCPQYTIRLDVNKFKLSRTQKRVLRNAHNYLKYGKMPTRKIPDPTLNDSNIHVPPPKPIENQIKKLPPFPKVERTDKGIKKKEIRKQRAIERRLKKGENIFEYQRKRKEREFARQRTIQSYLEDYVEGEWAHKLEVKTLEKGTPEFERSFEESYALFSKYQRTVHEDLNTTRKGYEGFLMSSPLITPAGDPNLPTLGSYHQHYVLDGKIIAVGVVDILPRCLSSKYFYYDPDYSFLTMGTYSALREIAFTQQLARTRPSLHYYYMGYYLQECSKMRYKGKFHPSDLLCDKTFKWMPLEQAVDKILANNSKFTVFYPDEPRPSHPSFHSIKCMFRDRVIMYPKLREEMAEPKLIEFDTRMEELCYYMHRVISNVVIFFPTMPAYVVGMDEEENSNDSGQS
uniref:Arginyltransferase n=1 Tax=Panagrolaimus sp. JU765 TaxID=591449 RepID=A0AC34QWT3_9BILA